MLRLKLIGILQVTLPVCRTFCKPRIYLLLSVVYILFALAEAHVHLRLICHLLVQREYVGSAIEESSGPESMLVDALSSFRRM